MRSTGRAIRQKKQTQSQLFAFLLMPFITQLSSRMFSNRIKYFRIPVAGTTRQKEGSALMTRASNDTRLHVCSSGCALARSIPRRQAPALACNLVSLSMGTGALKLLRGLKLCHASKTREMPPRFLERPRGLDMMEQPTHILLSELERDLGAPRRLVSKCGH